MERQNGALMRPICLAVTGWLLLSGSLFAQRVVLPGPYPDQNKEHWHVEPEGGISWSHGYYEESNGIEGFQIGEAFSDELIQDFNLNYEEDDASDWGNWKAASDDSCWMASAHNMMEYYVGPGNGRYQQWAYTEGIDGSFAPVYQGVSLNGEFNWTTGGFQHVALEWHGQSYVMMADDLHPEAGGFLSRWSWLDPVEFMYYALREGAPLGVGVTGYLEYDPSDPKSKPWGHALTAYGVDLDNKTLFLVDSDADWGGSSTFECGFEYNATENEVRLAYSDTVVVLDYLCAHDRIAWWVAGTGSWDEGLNWAARVNPTPHNVVCLVQSNLGTVTLDATAAAQRIIIDTPAESAGLLVADGAALSVGNGVVIAETERGLITQTGGNIGIQGVVELGLESTAEGIWQLDAGTASMSVLHVGGKGKGTVAQAGGDLSVSTWMRVASDVGSEGLYDQTGGTVTVTGDLWIAYEGDGTYRLGPDGTLSSANAHIGSDAGVTGRLEQTGGTHVVTGALNVGYAAGAAGEYALRDGALNVRNLTVGHSGTGTFEQEGGNVAVSATTTVGHDGGSDGRYIVSGGSVSTSSLLVGASSGAVGEFDLRDGQCNVSSSLTIGSTEGSGGIVKVSGLTASLTSKTVQVGKSGRGTLEQTAGTIDLGSSYLYLGYESKGDGGFDFGGGVCRAARVYLGHAGTGSVHQQAGRLEVATCMYVGNNLGSSGTYTLEGGSLEFGAGAWLDIGVSGEGRFEQSGGAHVANEIHLADLANGNGTYRLDDGTLQVASFEVGFKGTGLFEQSGGSAQVSGSMVVGHHPGSTGECRLGGGCLKARELHLGSLSASGSTAAASGSLEIGGTADLEIGSLIVGYGGVASVAQNDGDVTVTSTCTLAQNASATGEYSLRGGTLAFAPDAGATLNVGGRGHGTFHLHDGELQGDFVRVGGDGVKGGIGEFHQHGGTHSARTMHLGSCSGGQGVYAMEDGTLDVEYVACGVNAASGEFIQNGGQVEVDWEDVGYNASGAGTLEVHGGTHLADILVLGRNADSRGTLEVFGGGSLHGGTLRVGELGHGSLILHDGAEVEVYRKLVFGVDSEAHVAPGSTIRMTGSTFDIESTDPSALADLSNLSLIFEGGEDQIDALELACRDVGPSVLGYVQNFALDRLIIGGGDVGRVYLRDGRDNIVGWEGAEVLYVKQLVVTAGSTLDLRGATVYYGSLCSLGGTILHGGGSLIAVPEPSMLALITTVLLTFGSRQLRPGTRVRRFMDSTSAR